MKYTTKQHERQLEYYYGYGHHQHSQHHSFIVFGDTNYSSYLNLYLTSPKFQLLFKYVFHYYLGKQHIIIYLNFLQIFLIKNIYIYSSSLILM